MYLQCGAFVRQRAQLRRSSSAFQDDNFVDRMKEAKRSVVFYGDDTWLKLFPTQFDRSEGVSSFFVADTRCARALHLCEAMCVHCAWPCTHRHRDRKSNCTTYATGKSMTMSRVACFPIWTNQIGAR